MIPLVAVPLLAALALVAAVPVLIAIRAYLRYRGTRLVTCPETRAPAAVEVDAAHAAVSAALGTVELRLSECSRWPRQRGCGQECLRQIERAPADCLARTTLARWYEGKPCTFCRQPFGEIHWDDHRPGLRAPDGAVVGWHDVAAETLPHVLATHRPVCWNCLVGETFRRRHPEPVTGPPTAAKAHGTA
jgi:hypothetical protein